MSDPSVDQYLERIGYRGPLTPSPETLRALHRAHLLAIPYENLDIHLGRRLVLDPEPVFRKLVEERRGGWCYEMNGLFAWALGRLGFRVRMVEGTVGRDVQGDQAVGNHLVLLTELDQWYFTDVGFGDGVLEPLPLIPGRYRQGPFEFGLEADADHWVFRNQQYGAAKSFEFTTAPRTLASFAERCHDLQTRPTSGFVQKTVCQRHLGETIVSLRGAVLRTMGASGVTERIVTSGPEWSATLEVSFGLEIPGALSLWDRIWASHLEWQRSLAEARENETVRS